MDIGQVKERYGEKLCLWGNLDLDYVMSFGTPEEVKSAVRQTIARAGYGSGHILSTCNAIIECIPDENIYAMVEAAEEI